MGRGPPSGMLAPAGRGAPVPIGRGGGAPIGRGMAAPVVTQVIPDLLPIPSGLVPKKFIWQQFPKSQKNTIFDQLNIADSKESEIDYLLLAQMFCRSEEEIKAEEALKKAQSSTQT